MEVFDKEYAKTLRKTGSFDILFDYCASFRDDAVACSYLAICYYHGYGTPKDPKMVFFYDCKSSELGCADGKAGLAFDYRYGVGISKDEQKCIVLLNEAINEGSVKAQRFLGDCYEKGAGVEKDETKAVEWYYKAAEVNDAKAMRFLGINYENGIGVEKDETKAFEWYNKAAEAGDAVSMRYLGVCYENGEGVEKDEAKAVEWYSKAAEAGDAVSMRYLGMCYEEGAGVEKDETKAVEWYYKAAESGDAASMICLGECYENGIGVVKSGEQAIVWYKRAMDLGDESAEFRIGKMYFDGEAVEKNIQKAVDIFERGHVTKEDCLSTYYLAICYLKGEGVALNLKEAFKLLNIAANQGNTLAEIYLVYFYLRGIGTKKNYKKANRLIHSLESKEGYEEYQGFLNLYKGLIYYHGLGKKKDINKAKELFDKAPGVGTALYSHLCDGDYHNANFLGSIIFNSKSIAVGFLLYPDKEFSKDLLTKAYENECLSVRGHQALLQISPKYRKSKKARKAFYRMLCNEVIENNDDADLLCSLGRCYFYGYGTKQNYIEAVSRFIKSSEMGNSYSRVYLSYCYYNGLGIEKSNAKAVEVLGESIENRGDQANVLLGLLTYSGMCGIEKDRKKGIELIKANSNNAYDWSMDYLASTRGDSYIPFLLNSFFKRLHFSFDPSKKFKLVFPLFFRLLFLLIFRSPNSTSLSKKELLRMLLEKDDEFNQYQKQTRIENENLTAKMENLTAKMENLIAKTEDIGRDVKKIDKKIDELMLTLQKEITNEKKSFMNMDGEGEEGYQKFVDAVAKKMSDALYRSGNASVDQEEAVLKGFFGNYWDSLDAYTKKALVSARIFLVNSNAISFGSLDYSGVCISACSALEQELKLRFFTGYQEYIKIRFGDDYMKWPESIIYHQPDGTYIPGNNFTIGSLPYIFGSKKRNDKTGKRKKIDISSTEKKLLEEYIKTILNDQRKDIKVFSEGTDSEASFLDRCEDIRCIYRNTAAHTETLSLETATACCREVIGGETAAKTVGQVEGLIYDLVRLTRLPNN